MNMNELRAKIDTISGVMTAVREEIHDLENELQEIFESETHFDLTQKDTIYTELDILEKKYWHLKETRDKYIAWAN